MACVHLLLLDRCMTSHGLQVSKMLYYFNHVVCSLLYQRLLSYSSILTLQVCPSLLFYRIYRF